MLLIVAGRGIVHEAGAGTVNVPSVDQCTRYTVYYWSLHDARRYVGVSDTLGFVLDDGI
jgi:hypothetical protein